MLSFAPRGASRPSRSEIRKSGHALLLRRTRFDITNASVTATSRFRNGSYPEMGSWEAPIPISKTLTLWKLASTVLRQFSPIRGRANRVR